MTAVLFLMLAFQEPMLAALEQPIRVEGKVTQPEVIERHEPNFQEVLSRSGQRVRGILILEAVIDKKGHVQDVRLLRSTGAPALDEAELAAVRRWRFKPATLNGRPVNVYFTMTVNIHFK